jgi:hypothetical protein
MQANWEESMGKNPNDVWSAFKSDLEVVELSKFAKMIFSIVINQAGCKVKQMDCCSWLRISHIIALHTETTYLAKGNPKRKL